MRPAGKYDKPKVTRLDYVVTVAACSQGSLSEGRSYVLWVSSTSSYKDAKVVTYSHRHEPHALPVATF